MEKGSFVDNRGRRVEGRALGEGEEELDVVVAGLELGPIE